MSTNNWLTLMDNFFDDFNIPVSRSGFISRTAAVNVKEFDDRYEIYVSIPGLDPKLVDIEIRENILNISYEKTEKNEEKDKDGNYIRQEYVQNSFARSLQLPKNIDADSIQAESAKGVLTISVKKQPETQPRKIQIAQKD